MFRAIYKESSRINLILRKKEYRQSNQSLSPATFLVSLVPRTVTIHRNPRHSLQKAYPETTHSASMQRAREAHRRFRARTMARSFSFSRGKMPRANHPSLLRPCCSGDAFDARGGSALTRTLSLSFSRPLGWLRYTHSIHHSFYRLA